MIKQWNILHLKRRTDRAPFSFSNAERLGVPREMVKFWYAKDNLDYDNDSQAIVDAAVADGFKAFEGAASYPEPGKICQTWNVCRFLRELADRDSIEMFIHDGIMIYKSVNEKTFFYPDFGFFCEVVEECSKQRAKFKMLTIGTLIPFSPIEPIRPGSLILKGVHSTMNSIRVYSSLGAEVVLKRVLSEVETGNAHPDLFFHKIDSSLTLVDPCWTQPGMYTLLLQKIALDMDSEYFGSDSSGWESYQGAYKKFFGKT